MKSIFSTLFTLIMFVLVSCSTTSETTEEEITQTTKPNILLIIADDLGKDAMPNYSEGSIKPNIPNLQKLMNNGLTFDNLWSYPVCTPTRASMLTGKHGVKTGVLEVRDEISTSEISLQKFINTNTGNEYATAIVGKWHLSNDASDPITMGVDYFAGLLNGSVQDYWSWDLTENGNTTTSTEYTTTKFTDLAIDWVDAQTKPWFLWLAYNAPHTPFHLAPTELHSQGNLPSDDASISANPTPYFMSAIEAMDTEIGRLLNSMTDEERANTVIIFVGDNGSPNQVAQNPYRGQTVKGTLYQGGINVPMFVSGYGVNRTGARDQSLINTTDIYTTIANIAGVSTTNIYSSISFYNLFSSINPSNREFVYSENVRNTGTGYAIRNSTYKLIKYDSGNDEMYNLISDPYENTNLLNGTLTTEETNAKSILEAEANNIRN